jgi:hypothetical protein
LSEASAGSESSWTNADDRPPLIRSVGSRAATAWSTVAALPMLVRSHPAAPTGDLAQLGSIELDNDVDCQVADEPRLLG